MFQKRGSLIFAFIKGEIKNMTIKYKMFVIPTQLFKDPVISSFHFFPLE